MLLGAGAVVCIGIALYQTTKAKPQSISIPKTKEKSVSKELVKTEEKPPQYWSAELIKGIVTPIAPLTYSEAKDWVAMENDLLCVNQYAALAIVKFYPSAKLDVRHGPSACGYLNHYHLSSAHKSHIWFLGEAIIK